MYAKRDTQPHELEVCNENYCKKAHRIQRPNSWVGPQLQSLKIHVT